jgi:pSer/pThr/pTyr-binding forkhead associated (FHA) protein
VRHPWRLDVLRDGVELDPIDINSKAVWLVGRQPTCDIALEHPSLSRQHAVLQHRANGALYLFDLASTHGTFLNKQRVDPNTYVTVVNGDFIKFGGSTRHFIVQGGPDPDQRPAVVVKSAQVDDHNDDDQGAADAVTEPDADGSTAVFTGNAADFKEYMSEQRALAKSGKKAKKRANVMSARDAGFDASDMRGNRTNDRANDRLDFDEKRSFTASSRTNRATMTYGDDGDDDGEPNKEGSSDDDSSSNMGEDDTGGDALAARRHFGLDHETNETFDDSDDFYDRAAKSKGSGASAMAAGGDKSRALSYEELAARRDGLAAERGRVRDEIQWYAVNVLDADEFAGDGGDAGGDTLEQFEAQQAASEHKVIAKKLEQLESDIADAHAAAVKLARIATPSSEVAAEIDARVRAEVMWMRDSVVRQHMTRFDELCISIKRVRPPRPVAQSVALKALKPKRNNALTPAEIDAEERAIQAELQERREKQQAAREALAKVAATTAPTSTKPTAVAATAAGTTGAGTSMAAYSAGLNAGKRVTRGPTTADDDAEALPTKFSRLADERATKNDQ